MLRLPPGPPDAARDVPQLLGGTVLGHGAAAHPQARQYKHAVLAVCYYTVRPQQRRNSRKGQRQELSLQGGRGWRGGLKFQGIGGGGGGARMCTAENVCAAQQSRVSRSGQRQELRL